LTDADSNPTLLRIGTRGSDLARWQAEHVRDALLAAHPDLQIELCIISTRGDEILDRPLHEIGGKGLFVRAIEQQLLDRSVDIAVHSFKDMPAVGPDPLVIAATPPRADCRDALVGAPGMRLRELPPGTRLGTGSLRRGALAKKINPGVTVVPIRGNVPTRVGKVDSGECDAVMLAAAGLTRLGLADRITEALPPDEFCPAPAQGILALQCRVDDEAARARLSVLADASTTIAAAAERGFLRRLGASCTVPVGCHAVVDGTQVRVHGLVIDPSGAPGYEDTVQGPVADAEALGIALAEDLMGRGGKAIIDRLV
jgi:hydroxymethylbilane synthase